MKLHGRILTCVFILSTFVPTIGWSIDYMVDDFESGIAAWHWGGSWSYRCTVDGCDSFAEENSVVYAGSKGLRLTQTRARYDRYFTMIARASPSSDLTGYSSVSFWCRTAASYGSQTYWGTHPGVGLKIYLKETSGERWSSSTFTYPTTSWGKVEYPFSQLTVVEDAVNGVLDLNSISEIWISGFAGNGNTVDPVYYIDNLVLSAPYIPAVGELFKFENGSADLLDWWVWHNEESTWKAITDVPAYVYNGTYAMEVKYDQSLSDPSATKTNWWMHSAIVNAEPYHTDWSGYNTIAYSVREQFYSSNTARIVVFEDNGQKWEEIQGHILTTGYQRIHAHLVSSAEDGANGFASVENGSAPYGNNTTLDLGAIAKVELKFHKGSTEAKSPQYVYFYVDDIMLTNQTWWTPPAEGVLFDFEYGVGEWTAWNAESNITAVASETDSSYVHEGGTSMRIQYDQSLLAGNPSDYFRRYATANARPYWTNWSGYSGVAYWMRSETDDTNTIHMVIEEQSGQKWQQTHKTTATSGWNRIKAYFDVDKEHGFTIYEWGRGEAGTNLTIDLDGITNVYFRVDKGRFGSKAPPQYTRFYIDDVVLLNESIPTYTPPASPGLFDFENGNFGLWFRWNVDLTALDVDLANPHAGDRALAFSYNQGTSGTEWMHQFATITHSNPIPDWSSFKQIVYWAKGSEFSGNTIVVKLIETNGQEWIQRKPTLLTNIWQEVHVVLLSGVEDAEGFGVHVFGQGESGTNVTLDLDMIGQVVFEINKQTKDAKTPDWTTVYLDDMALSTTPPTPYAHLTVDGTVVGFGSLIPIKEQYRFVSTNSINVSWETSGLSDSYWGLFAYTRNAANALGLRGMDEPEYGLMTRWWTGPDSETEPPDPMNSVSWTNDWGYLNDQYGELNPLLDTEGEVAAGAVGSFQLHFAVQAGGSYTQDYSAPVTVELRLGE